MLTEMARINEVYANSIEIGGRGKPSTMMAIESNQRGSKLAMVVLNLGTGLNRLFAFIITSICSIPALTIPSLRTLEHNMAIYQRSRLLAAQLR